MNKRLEFAKQTKLDAPENYCDEDFAKYVTYGENCVIKPSAVIGGFGFGFERDVDGELHHLYHFGRVLIGNNVWIGSNTSIDRGTVDDTVIGDGTKIDNNVHIAHNCKIGKNVLITAGVILCGRVTIEDNVWIGVGASIRQGLTIGKGAFIGMGAVVVKDVPPEAIVYGNPAKKKE